MVDFTAATVWNMDEARMKAIDFYLSQAEACFVEWDLENLYKLLAQVRRMISGKIREEEYETAGSVLKEIEKLRRSVDPDDEKGMNDTRCEIFDKSDELYVYLNRLMKRHGMFFKEGDDPSRAALKR